MNNVDLKHLIDASEELFNDIDFNQLTEENITSVLQTTPGQPNTQEKRGRKRKNEEVYQSPIQPFFDQQTTMQFTQPLRQIVPRTMTSQNTSDFTVPMKPIIPSMTLPPQVPSFKPSLKNLIEVTAKLGKRWPKLYGELNTELKANIPLQYLQGADKLRVFIGDLDNQIMLFNGREFVGILSSDVNFMVPLLRNRAIAVTVSISHNSVQTWPVGVTLKVYVNKKSLVPEVDSKDISPDEQEESTRIKHPFTRLFDMIDQQRNFGESAKIRKTNEADVSFNREYNDLDDDDLDNYIDWDAKQNSAQDLDKNEMDNQVLQLYQAVSKSLDDNTESTVSPPKELKLKLRNYQLTALAWMYNRETKGTSNRTEPKLHPLFQEKQFADGTKFYYSAYCGIMTRNFVMAPPDPRGGILADEMGLGKTIEILSLMLKNKPQSIGSTWNSKDQKFEAKSTLIVCPVTLVEQWKNEIVNHTSPPLNVYIYMGGRRIREAAKLVGFDAIITTYSTLSNEYAQILKREKELGRQLNYEEKSNFPLFQIRFFRIVLDEAHNIKNRKSLQGRACTAVDADCRWAVTGTPIHNHIDDLFSLFHFIRVYPHGDWRWWAKNIARPFEKKKPEAIKALQQVMGELMIRRTKNKKINGVKIIELPKKSVQHEQLEFSKPERILYESLYQYSKGIFNEFEKSGTVLKNYANILEMILHLRQVCNHPALLLYSYQTISDSGSLKHFLTQFGHISNNSLLTQVLPIWPQVLQNPNCDIETLLEMNWISSAKIDALIRHLRKLDGSTKSIVFSQWVTMLDVVEIALDKAGINYVRFDGSMSRKDRDETLQTFKNNPNISVCLFSLKAGGFGLNLVWATHVFLLDPWWNPAIEEQAINRVHRIGQDKPVTVIRFTIKNTIEDRIIKLQETKIAMAQNLGMSNDQEILSLGVTKKEAQDIRLEDLRKLFSDNAEDDVQTTNVHEEDDDDDIDSIDDAEDDVWTNAREEEDDDEDVETNLPDEQEEETDENILEKIVNSDGLEEFFDSDAPEI